MSIVSNAAALPDTSRVWVYQADRPFPADAVPAVRAAIQRFVEQWVSHNRRLRAYGDLLHDRFVVLMVDESQADASGCSIDSSVYFLKGLQQEFGVDLFDRMRFSFLEGEEVHTVDRNTFEQLYREGKITEETPVFDPLVNTKGALDRQFIKPLKESWHMRLL